MILGYLILAHLLGDFIFQPSKLVFWKMSSKWGILVHCLIHFTLLNLVFAPFLLNGNYAFLSAIAFVVVCHFFIDYLKISYDLKHNNKIVPFLVDQLLHLIAIGLAASFMIKSALPLPRGEYLNIYTDVRIIVFLSAVICVSAVVEVFYFQMKRQKDKNAKFHPSFSRMLIHIAILVLAYGAALMLLTPYL